MQTSLREIDMLKSLIYEDFLQSIASVRIGLSPDTAFLEHEMRVRNIRQKVAIAEAGPVRLRVVTDGQERTFAGPILVSNRQRCG